MNEFLELFSREITFRQVLLYCIIGAFAGLVRELSINRNIIVVPRKWKNDKQGGWDLGILGSVICSVFIAIIVDHSIVASAAAGVGAPHLIELWAKRFKTARMNNRKETDNSQDAG